MQDSSRKSVETLLDVIFGVADEPSFRPSDHIRILSRSPIGPYRMPFYLCGKRGTIEAVIDPAAIDNDEGGYDQNAGPNLHHYRVAIPMTEIWPDYRVAARWPAHRDRRGLACKDLRDRLSESNRDRCHDRRDEDRYAELGKAEQPG